MRYMDAFKAIFKSENWGMQLLLHSICMLIPILGFIVLMGHYLEVLVFQHEKGEDTYPEFDFKHFTRYLSRGVTPFVAGLLMALIIIPMLAVVMAPLIAIPALDLRDEQMIAPIAAASLLYVVLIVVLLLVQVPMYVAAGITQKIGAGFRLGFIKDFIGRVGGAILMAHLFTMAISLPLVIAGYATCGIGLYPAIAILMFTQWQLHRQIYELYLERGGERLTIAQELREEPATLAPQQS